MILDKLKEAEARWQQIDSAIAQPGAAADQETYRRLMKEYKQLSPVVEKYRAYREAEGRAADADEILGDASADADLRALAEEERRTAAADCTRLLEELTVLLLPRDPLDEKNVVVEIRAGAGGDEAALFAAVLYRMYSMYAASHGFHAERLNAAETGLGGLKEVSFLIEGGDGAYSRLKFESGVHRVQRVPETETSGRIHTSTVTVAVLPEAEEVEVEIAPGDVRIETCKSSGAGGQHVNKTESAIRLIHLPTGMVIECQDERSQVQNRAKAFRILRSRLYEKMQEEQRMKIASERRSQVGTGDRSERIRTYNYPQGRVTDHRIGLTLHNLDAVLNGDLDTIIDALISADTARRLAAGNENL